MIKPLLFGFDGIAPSTLCSIDLNPFDEGGIFGSGDDEKAKGLSKDAIAQWQQLQGQVPGATVHTGIHDPLQGQTTYDQSLSFSADPFSSDYAGANIHGYTPGERVNYQGIDYTDPGSTSWSGAESGWSGAGSAYDDFAPDQTGRQQQIAASDFYAGAMRNPVDAIADADYARRRSQAEQARRGQNEGAMRELEARGQGGGTEQLLAQLVGNAGQASDQYQAGLDTAAQAQARRDNAAGQYATIGGQLYNEDASAANMKAAGTDAYDVNRRGGLDTFATNKLNASDTWNKGVRDYGVDLAKYNADQANAGKTYNANRVNSTADANTALGNKVGEWNSTGQQQQRFNNQIALAGGMTGATGNAAQIYQNAAVHPLQDVVLPTVANVAKAAA